MSDIVDRKKYGERMRGFPGVKPAGETAPQPKPSPSPSFDAIRAHLMGDESELPAQAEPAPTPTPTATPSPQSMEAGDPYSDEAYKALLEEIPTAGPKKKK